MNDAIYFAKLSSGCTLRKTTNKDQSKRRYYASVEILGKVRFMRISKTVYDRLNNELARSKCAFTTNIVNDDKIQYDHCIAL